MALMLAAPQRQEITVVGAGQGSGTPTDHSASLMAGGKSIHF